MGIYNIHIWGIRYTYMGHIRYTHMVYTVKSNIWGAQYTYIARVTLYTTCYDIYKVLRYIHCTWIIDIANSAYYRVDGLRDAFMQHMG